MKLIWSPADYRRLVARIKAHTCYWEALPTLQVLADGRDDATVEHDCDIAYMRALLTDIHRDLSDNDWRAPDLDPLQSALLATALAEVRDDTNWQMEIPA